MARPFLINSQEIIYSMSKLSAFFSTMHKTQSMVEKHACGFWEQVKKQYSLLTLKKLNGGIL